MRIVRVEAWTIELAMEEPYAIAYADVASAPNVFVRLITDGGKVGLGCASPDPDVTGETHESILRGITEIVEPALRGEDALAWRRHLGTLESVLPAAPSARAAVDIAFHDLLGKVAGLPLWRLLGGTRTAIETSITIGVLDEPSTLERAQRWVRRGFRRLKIKGGKACDEDIARMRRVREEVGPHVGLSFDANQGYGVEDAIRFARETARVGLEFLEQPTPKARIADLARVRGAGVCPIMADEPVLSATDVLTVIRERSADLVNVKLMKSGGIRSASAMVDVARAGGLGVMVGCMDEAALGIAAAMHLALASPDVAYADLDGHIGLLDDPTAGAVILRDGLLAPIDGAGLGVT
jgi:L-Ala-D/L-Glu epimerase